MEVANTHALNEHVRNWLVHDQVEALVNYLSTAIYENQIEKLSRFGNNLDALGVNLSNEDNTNLDECDSGCKWVPATFSQHDGQSVYGGVALMPKLSSQSNKGFKGFQASAGKSGKAGSSSGFSHGGSSSGGGGGKGGGKGGSKPPTKRDEVMKTYENGKEKPIRVGKIYFGKPGTGV